MKTTVLLLIFSIMVSVRPQCSNYFNLVNWYVLNGNSDTMGGTALLSPGSSSTTLSYTLTGNGQTSFCTSGSNKDGFITYLLVR